MRFKNLFLTLLTSILYLTVGFANDTQQQSIFDKLQFDETVNVNITVDMNALTGNIRSEKKHEAVFSYQTADGATKNWDIKVKLRGKFRRMICKGTPPLKLFFDKDDLKNEGLAKYNDLKLVNYCGDDKEEAREFLLKEYLTYKMYNQITEASFRVQLIEVTYQDTKSDQQTKQLAFLVEDTAQLRARLGAKKYKAPEDIANKPSFDSDQTKTMMLFQYMIGNTDWQLNFEKNTKYIVQNDNLLVIPYDFDFSGMVNPSYGRVNSDYGLTSFTERAFLGTEADLENMTATLEKFQSKKKALIELVKSNDLLKRKSRKEMVSYLNSFFENLSVETLTAAIPRKGEDSDKLITNEK